MSTAGVPHLRVVPGRRFVGVARAVMLPAIALCGPHAVAAPGASAAATINLSRDLVRLGIATENLPPDDPSFDARPLFQATIAYAALHQTKLLTVNHGTYYFLTPEDAQTYLRLPFLSGLTVDFANSKLLFAGAFLQGIALVDCQHVTLTDFDLDFITPPYTEVTLQAANPTARTLQYGAEPGWADPATFDAGAANQPPTAVALWAVAFRDGDIVPGTSRMAVAQPIASGTLALVQDNTPWTQAGTLATLRPGDVVVVTERGGSPPIIAVGGEYITISHGTVRGASAIAVLLNGVSHSTVDAVSVEPRQGSMISSNADGVHFVDAGADNHIRNSFVTRTLDDALAIDALDAALVASQAGPSRLTVTRRAYARFANGSLMDFVDPVSAVESPGGVIVSQTPPDSGTPVFDGSVTLTFDRSLPALAAGSGMVFADKDLRGQGSSIEGNSVQEILFGRGIWVAGVEGVTVANNTIGRTSNGGIAITEATSPVYPVPPASGITVEDNSLNGSLGPMASGSGTQIAVGAIIVESTNDVFSFTTAPANTNITIQRNAIFGSGRSGIWVGELAGGAILNNVIASWDWFPDLPLYGVSQQTGAQLHQDFTQPIVVHNSQNVRVRGNSNQRAGQ